MLTEAFFRLKNQIQTYDWGTTDAFTLLFGWQNPNKEKRAELWMGAHPKAPSTIHFEGRELELTEWIKTVDAQLLGKKLGRSRTLPFLFKVLSANQALSIQVHPNKTQAEVGFLAEEEKQIPTDAFNRNYKDQNHKPELICALTPFVAMCGFRPAEEILSLVESLDLEFLEQVVDDLRSALLIDHTHFYATLKTTYLDLMRENEAETDEVVQACIKIIGNKPTENDLEAYKKQSVLSPYLECLLLNESYPGDLSILSPLLMNLYHLDKGKALFLDAGIPHAYLRGTGLEIMASSDNVLRGGLTPKYIDKAELNKVMTSGPHRITLTTTQIAQQNVYHYPVPVNDFQLCVVHQEADEPNTSFSNEELAIVLCVAGEIHINNGNASGSLKAGESAALPPSSISISGSGKLAIASQGV